MIHVQSLVQRLESELGAMARRREARGGTAARARDAMQVDVVRHLAGGVVLEMKLHRVALAHANEAAGHGSAESPERVLHAFGDLALDLLHFELDDDLGRCAAPRRRRNVGRARERRLDGFTLRRAEVTLARATGVRRRRSRRPRVSARHTPRENLPRRSCTSHFFICAILEARPASCMTLNEITACHNATIG